MPTHTRRLFRTARARRRLAAARRLESAGDLAGACARSRVAAHALVTEVERPGGPGACEVVAAFHEAARLHRAVVDLPTALSALDAAAEVIQGHPGMAQRAAWACETLTLRGDTLRLLARYDEAGTDLRAAEIVAPSARMRAGACNSLGIWCKDTGDFDAAADWYGQALQAADGPGAEPLLAAIEHNLAGLAYARGEHAEGEPHIRRAIALRATAPDSAASLLSDRTVLAALLAAARRDDEARPMLESLIAAWTALRGADHYEVAHCRHHLGLLLARGGDGERAGTELEASLGVLQHVLGPTHPEVRAAADDLAEVLSRSLATRRL